MEAYTAEQLAERARLELGAEVTPRTIYFYRQLGVLSPAETGMSQPGFSGRNYLELAAALALQRAPDRPTLAEISSMLRGLTEEGLREVAGAVGPTARRLVAEAPGGPLLERAAPPACPADWETLSAAREDGPRRMRVRPTTSGPAGPKRTAGSESETTRGVTITLAPGVTLHVGPDAPRELVAKLLELSLDHARDRD